MARPPRSLSFLTILALLVALSTIAAPSDAETWTIASGFSETTNPNGNWTYGYQVSPGTPLLPFTTRIETSGIDVWCINSNPDAAGNVNANLSGGPVDMSGMWWDTGGIAMHPGPNGERAIVRWIAPQSVIAMIDVTFAGANYAQGATTDVHVLLNDTSVFDGTVSGFGLGGPHGVSGSSPSQSYNGRVFAAAGDRIDFVVGPGGNGFGYDLTGISGTVTSLAGYGILRGMVTAGTTGNPPLGGATIATSDGSISTTSGLDGSYELLLPVGTHTVAATYPGAVSPPATVTIAEAQIAAQDFQLTPGDGLVYYVAPTGDDSNDGRSMTSAWKTISRGDQLGVLQPGDIVAVMPGTYRPADFWGVRLVNRSGSPDKPILYKTLGQVLIDQTDTARPADGVTYGIRVEVDSVTIEGFEITGCQWGIYFNDGYSGNSAIGNVIHGIRAANPNQPGFPGWCGGICNSVASGNLNRNNLIYDIGDSSVTNIAACIASPIATDTKIVNNTLIGARTGVEVWAGGD